MSTYRSADRTRIHLKEMHPLPSSRPSLVLFLTFSFLLLLFPSSLATTPFCHHDEATALLQFKHSFSVNSSTFGCPVVGVESNPRTESWKEGTNCCKWEGVSCDNVTGHIVGLDLFGSQLYGSFPLNSTLFSLQHLQRLSLASNDFRNSKIPLEFSRLTALKHLDLSCSSFHGEVPSEISHLSNLVYLDLSSDYNQLEMERDAFRALVQNLSRIRDLSLDGVDMSSTEVGLFANLSSALAKLGASFCSLEGRLPEGMFSRLSQLESILLTGNDQLTGKLPDSIGQYSNSLHTLGLGFCNFSGPIPKSLGNLSQLTDLDLQCNHLTGNIPNFLSRKLESIYLQRNELQGSIPSSIYEQKDLLFLDLSSNNFSGLVDFYRLSKLQNLYSLNLSHTTLTFNSSTTITLSKNLEFLDISSNSLQGVLPPLPSRLRWLILSNNSLFGEIPSSICKATYLELLDLSHNKFNATIPGCLFNSGNSLRMLHLGWNNLRGIIPTTFAKGCQLEFLGLNENQLEGALPASISHCKGLQVLNLAANLLNDSIPSWVEALPKLKVLILRSNKFRGWLRTFHKHKHPFQKLQILDLSNNQLSGPIPKDYIKNLKSIMYPDRTLGSSYMYIRTTASGYEFSVNLPSKGSDVELERRIFTTLASIDLSDNKFSGEIPENMGMLEALNRLNLSHNKLSGQIPPSLGNLKNLEWLDLSSNKLTGQIPMELTDLWFLSTLNLSSNELWGPIPQGNQFATFSNDSYAGNKGLCGFPLTKQCSNSKGEAPQPFAVQQPADDFVHQSVIEWKAVLMGYPCGVSFGISLACFVFKNGNPKWFLMLVRFVRIKRHV